MGNKGLKAGSNIYFAARGLTGPDERGVELSWALMIAQWCESEVR